jgi:hypothetical protein
MLQRLRLEELIEASEKGAVVREERASSARARGGVLLALAGASFFAADKLFDFANTANERLNGLLMVCGGGAAFLGTVALGGGAYSLSKASAESQTAERLLLEATMMEHSLQAMAQEPSTVNN